MQMEGFLLFGLFNVKLGELFGKVVGIVEIYIEKRVLSYYYLGFRPILKEINIQNEIT